MPQHSLHPLVYILLMWITIISIIQVVFITFFFTMGQNGQSSSRRTEDPSGTHEPLVLSTLPPSTAMPLSKTNMMVTYEARWERETIKWYAAKPQPHLISESGETLLIKTDGFYFLSLRVTLTPCDQKQNHTVRLEKDDKVLLEGWINNDRRSSGQLSKVEGLSAPCKLKVTIHPPTSCINQTEAVTHLDIIFMK